MKKVKITALFAGICIIVFFAVASGYAYLKNYQKERQTSQTLENVKKQGKILSDDLVDLGDFGKDTSPENQQRYISGVDKKLSDPGLDEKTKNTLLLRKAMILAVRRGAGSSDRDRDEASDILKNFIFPPAGSSVDPFVHDFAIGVFVHLHFQCCETRPFAEEFPQLYKPYADKGYSPRIAKILVLNKLTELVFPERSNDVYIVSNSMLHKAELLTFYKSELQQADLANIAENLGKQVASFDTLQEKTYTDYIDAKLEPLLFYAYGYDAYHSYTMGTDTQVILAQNKAIDRYYDVVFEKLTEAEQTGTDKISLNLMRLYNGFRYARSMDSRYVDVKSNPKMTALVDSMLANIKSNREVKSIADAIFKGNVQNQKISSGGYFIGLSKKYPQIAEYMNSIGISQDSY